LGEGDPHAGVWLGTSCDLRFGRFGR
jgi:hypothetical protein